MGWVLSFHICMNKINQSKYEFHIIQIFEDKITNIKYELEKVIDW